jgi:acetate kinase
VAAAHFILVINAGSSSVKFALYDAAQGDLIAGPAGAVEGIGAQPRLRVRTTANDDHKAAIAAPTQEDALAAILQWIDDYRKDVPLTAVGHRVVHGGEAYSAPVRIDAAVLDGLEKLVPLAPLHQPHSLAAICSIAAHFPDLPQVACFDTAFHCTQPPAAQTYALPRRMHEEGIRSYGFHGLSYEYVASVLPSLGAELSAARIVVAHLGNGASMCAMHAGRSVATTMGFTALDGLPMGTRCGALDPGVLLYLISNRHMDARQLEDLLYHQSGLLGVSGISSDMRTLLASSDSHAEQAVDLFVYRIGRELGSLAAALGGLDAVVFTAGIGENAAAIRARVCRDADWLGVRLDDAANQNGGPCISSPAAGVSAWVVHSDENLMIARHTLRLLSAGGGF